MAYALKLPVEVTRLIDAMYDVFWERVLRDGGTPSCISLENFSIEADPPHPEFSCEVEENEFVITEYRREQSQLSPYPNITVYDALAPWKYAGRDPNTGDVLWYQEECQFLDLRQFHEPSQRGRGSVANPPDELITTRVQIAAG